MDSITINEYQKSVRKTALPQCYNIEYMAIGLGNETGEVLGEIKKAIRNDPRVTEDPVKFREGLKSELGDVMWYLAGVCSVMGFNMQEVMEMNLEKVNGRIKRGSIQGDGSDR